MKHGKQYRGRLEDANYAPANEAGRGVRGGPENWKDVHAGPGTTKEGAVLTNEVYRQPWVEHDAVADPDGDMKTG